VQGAQLVLFCVKSNDTETGAAAIKPHLAPDALVLSLQNGVENADRLRALLQQEVVAAAVYVGDRNGRAGACQASRSRRIGHRALEGQR
jgi:2-dehydropantoate 2-reductase